MNEERQKELQEVNAMIGALCKKYNVSLGVSLIDLNEKPQTGSEAKEETAKAIEAEVA